MLLKIRSLGPQTGRRTIASTSRVRGYRASRPVVEAMEGRALMAITSVTTTLYNYAYQFDRISSAKGAVDSNTKSGTQDINNLQSVNLSDTRSSSMTGTDHLGTYSSSITSQASVDSTLGTQDNQIVSGTFDTSTQFHETNKASFNGFIPWSKGNPSYTITLISDSDGYIKISYNGQYTSNPYHTYWEPNGVPLGSKMDIAAQGETLDTYNTAVIGSDGEPHLNPNPVNSGTTTLPIKANTPFKITFTALYVYIEGEQNYTEGGSSNIQWSFTPNGGTDLAASISSNAIVPTQATDLNLYHFFGTEQVNVPVTIQNKGTSEAKGDVEATVYLSTTPDLSDPNSVQFGQPLDNPDFDLQGNGQTTVTVSGTINGSQLEIGTKYYFVCQITSPTIQESDAAPDSTDTNNIAATSRTFEFVGTPQYNPDVFTDGTYFNFIRETLEGITAAKRQKADVDVNNLKSFVGAFEGDSLSPYLDNSSNHYPTISVGINISAQIQKITVKKGKKLKTQTVITSLGHSLADDVRKYRHLPLVMSDLGVLDWLMSQARKHHWTGANQGPPVISQSDDQTLFNMALPDHERYVQNALGATYGTIGNRAQIAVVDLAYNVGNVAKKFPTVMTNLRNSDFVQAGFNLVDAQRTTDPENPGLELRTEAEYQNLLDDHLGDLGQYLL